MSCYTALEEIYSFLNNLLADERFDPPVSVINKLNYLLNIAREGLKDKETEKNADEPKTGIRAYCRAKTETAEKGEVTITTEATFCGKNFPEPSCHDQYFTILPREGTSPDELKLIASCFAIRSVLQILAMKFHFYLPYCDITIFLDNPELVKLLNTYAPVSGELKEHIEFIRAASLSLAVNLKNQITFAVSLDMQCK